jgi:hypothetical protein
MTMGFIMTMSSTSKICREASPPVSLPLKREREGGWQVKKGPCTTYPQFVGVEPQPSLDSTALALLKTTGCWRTETFSSVSYDSARTLLTQSQLQSIELTFRDDDNLPLENEFAVLHLEVSTRLVGVTFGIRVPAIGIPVACVRWGRARKTCDASCNHRAEKKWRKAGSSPSSGFS